MSFQVSTTGTTSTTNTVFLDGIFRNISADNASFGILSATIFNPVAITCNNIYSDEGTIQTLTATDITAQTINFTDFTGNRFDCVTLNTSYINCNTNANMSLFNCSNSFIKNSSLINASVTELQATNTKITTLYNNTINSSTINASNITISNAINVPNDALTIAKTASLQASLDSKQPNLVSTSNISVNNISAFGVFTVPLFQPYNMSVTNISADIATINTIDAVNFQLPSSFAIDYLNFQNGMTRVGYNIPLIGASSTAVGNDCTTTGSYASVIGYNNDATGNHSVILGSTNSNTTSNSVAIGYGNSVTGVNGIAIGNESSAQNNQTLSLGYRCKSTSAGTTAVGYNCSATHTRSTAIGYKAVTTADDEIVLGTNTNNSMAKFKDNTLTIGNVKTGTSSTSASWAHTNRFAEQGSYAITQTSDGTTSINSASSKNLYFNINNSAKMTLTSGGNVGIGNTGPNEKLQVDGRIRIYETTGSQPTATAGSLILEHGNANGRSSIVFPSRTNYGSDFGFIEYRDDRDFSSGNERSALIIGTQNDGDDNVILVPGGNVGIGTRTPGYKLQVEGSAWANSFSSSVSYCNLVYAGSGADVGANGCIQVVSYGTSSQQDGAAFKASNNTNHIINFVNTTGSVRGKIRGVNSDNVAYDTSSDRRLKKNITDMNPMMDKIKEMKAVQYDWKSDDTHDYGFIAQDIFKIFPHMRPNICSYTRCSCKNGKCENCPLTEDEHDNPCECDMSGNEKAPYYYGLDYGKFTPYIVKALQEVIEVVDTLKIKINDLESENDILTARVEELENIA